MSNGTEAAAEEDSGYSMGERVPLIIFYICCTVLTTSFNAFTLFTIINKVELKKSLSCIPVLCSSVLGLLHGLGQTLFQTIAMIMGDWPGAFFWCVTARNIHTYVVYATVYCSTTQIMEAAYRVSHPFTYNKSGRGAYYGMWAATIFALLVNLPTHILQYTILKPTDYVEHLSFFFNDNITESWSVYENYIRAETYPYYHGDSHPGRYCGRQWVLGSFDFIFIVNWFMVTNTMAVALIIASSLLIAYTLRRSNRKLGGDQAKQAALNRRVAKSAVIMTSITLLPWLPNLIYSIICFRSECISPGIRIVADICVNLYFTVPWVFALVNMMKNPSLRKPQKELLEKTMGSFTTYAES